jgi:hypothetical protein
MPPLHIKFIELRKVSATDSPSFPPTDPALYVAGSPSIGSIPVNHSIKGWLRSGPAIGESLIIDRTERNGVPVLGIFVSSAVITFDEKRIQTLNSVYFWQECAPPSRPAVTLR